MIAAAVTIPTRFTPNCSSDWPVSYQSPSTAATAALPAAGIVVTEMNTPTSTADRFEVSDSIPAVPASSAVISENHPGW